ncbi:MAG: peptidoglycan-binding protein [Ilumatobacter sp.]|nr:peptidoglycan-binding protein [Ilumatobacter sp.]
MDDLIHPARRHRRGRRCLVAAVLTVGAIAGSAGSVGADKTVRHDAAGEIGQVSLIGDSTLAGVRWYADYGSLRSFDFVLNAESCRRTVVASCISREGYRSATVVETIHTLGDELGEVLVVMSGYNDPADSIDDAITAVTDTARSYGVEHVVWLTLRSGADVDYSDPQEQSSTDTFRQYNERLIEAAAESGGFLQVADWATYSTGAGDWFEYDGVHLTPRGVDAVTTYISGILQRVLAGGDVSPAAAPWTILVPGAEGEVVAETQAALIEAGIDVPGGADGVYGNDTMVAVAAYQREAGDLQVTGAVDEATARSLGVYGEAEEEPAPTTVPTTEPAVVAPTAPAPTTVATQSSGVDTGSSVPTIAMIVLGVFAALVGAIVARRRYVVKRRRERRWARTHPATSPLRSVADDRRADREPAEHGSGQTRSVLGGSGVRGR